MGAFDVVVLGGGTAGVQVATEVAGGGKTVALVEAGLIGGESAYLACLPSNSLLLSAARGKTWEDAVARRDEVTGGLDDSAPARRLSRAGVTVIRGTGRVTGPGTVEVGLAQGSVSLTYSDLVIATGCELTQVYASFGSQVTLVEAEPRLLPGEPAFAGEILAAALRRAGAEIYLGSQATKAERTADGLTLALEDGTRIDADRLLLASGRRPRLGGLGLDALGLKVTPGMALPTTTRCEVTGLARVWAAGDVTGTTHTHASRYQAGVVAANILGQRREADYSAIPRCVFTTPSVYGVGVIPAKGGTALTTVRVQLGDTIRAQLGQDDLGCLELYAEGGVLVGAVAVGPDAATWMGEVTLAIRAKISLAVLADVVRAFPTYGEALEAALRELAGTPNRTVSADQKEKGIGPLSELDMETPEDDALEQHQEVIDDDTVTTARREVPFDVNEADAAEQERAVGFDDDDYR